MNLVDDLGIQQFTILPCNLFSAKFLEHCKQGMAQISQRSTLLSGDMFLVIVSQTCDIFNSSAPYIEGFIFKKARARDVSSESIKYTRNYQKILLEENITGAKDWFLIKKENRVFLDKALLIDELEPNDKESRLLLSIGNRSMLLDWLTRSYTRVALPDGFNRAFFTPCRNKEHPIHSFLISNKKHILEMYVFCTPLDDEAADKYDVAFTALVSSNCEEDEKESIESEFNDILGKLAEECSNLNFLQIDKSLFDVDKHINAVMELVMTTAEFSKQDEMNTHRLNLDFICYMSSGCE